MANPDPECYRMRLDKVRGIRYNVGGDGHVDEVILGDIAMRRIVRQTLFVAAVSLLTAGPVSSGKVIYVDDDAVAPGDGTSWATAYRFLQDALTGAATAEKPVEIRVAQGLYKPDRSAADPEGTGDRKATFRLIHELTLRGGYAGVGTSDPNAWDSDIYETVLSGDLAGNDIALASPLDASGEPTREDNSYNVVRADDDSVIGDKFTSVLEGFVIAGGHAYYEDNPGGPSYRTQPEHVGGGLNLWFFTWSLTLKVTVRQCVFENNYAEEAGGAISSYRVDALSLVDCRIAANGTRGHGGGLHVMFGSAQMTDCRFDGNASGLQGGAIACQDDDNVTLTHCALTNNTAYDVGGSIAVSHSPTKLTDCVLRGNCTGGNGGGIHSQGAYSLELLRCWFVSNAAAHKGGAIASSAVAAMDFTGCLFCGNTAQVGGGVVRSVYCDRLSFCSCTVVGNRGPKGALLLEETRTPGHGSAEVVNCIVSDAANEIWTDKGEVTLQCSDLVEGEAGIYDPNGFVVWAEGNLNADPCFVNPGYWDINETPADPNDDFFVEGDYHLKSQAGHWDPESEDWVQDDVTSLCIDAGDPNSPIMDEPFPNGGVINMGAYGGTTEASKSYFGVPLCETIIAGDINGDCHVDIADVIILLDHWLQSGERAEE